MFSLWSNLRLFIIQLFIHWHDLFIQYSTFIREHSVIDSPVIPSYAVVNEVNDDERSQVIWWTVNE